MGKIRQQQRQCMPARRKFDDHFSLTAAEVTMVGIRRDRAAQVRHGSIDEKVMMPGFRLVDAGRSDTHPG